MRPTINLPGTTAAKPTAPTSALQSVKDVASPGLSELVSPPLVETRVRELVEELPTDPHEAQYTLFADEIAALVKENPLPARDPEMFVGKIDLGDGVQLVERILEDDVLHPLTDRAPKNLVRVNQALHQSLSLGECPYRVLGVSDSLRHRTSQFAEQQAVLTGEVESLVVYSYKPGHFNADHVKAAIAQSLKSEGLNVFTDQDWTTFVVETKDPFGMNTHVTLSVAPFEPARDMQSFFGYREPIYTRRFGTASLADVGASLQKDGSSLIFIEKSGPSVERRVLTPIDRAGENPHLVSKKKKFGFI